MSLALRRMTLDREHPTPSMARPCAPAKARTQGLLVFNIIAVKRVPVKTGSGNPVTLAIKKDVRGGQLRIPETAGMTGILRSK